MLIAWNVISTITVMLLVMPGSVASSDGTIDNISNLTDNDVFAGIQQTNTAEDTVSLLHITVTTSANPVTAAATVTNDSTEELIGRKSMRRYYSPTIFPQRSIQNDNIIVYQSREKAWN